MPQAGWIRQTKNPRVVRGLLPEGNFHLCIAARGGGIDGGNHSFNVAAQYRPLSVSERNDSDFPGR
jgi:hypothetical protein